MDSSDIRCMQLEWYLVIDEQLSGGVQALQQHQLVRLRRNGVRQRRADPALRGPQPQADGEGPQRRDGVFHNGIHVVCPSWEGQSVALWEGMSGDTWVKSRKRAWAWKQRIEVQRELTSLIRQKDQIDLYFLHIKTSEFLKQGIDFIVFLIFFPFT